MRFTRREAVRSVALLAVLVACGRHAETAPDRCGFCGMRIPRDSHWVAGALDANGQALVFDTPGCLFRYRASSRGAGLHGAWFTEYYGPAGLRTDAASVQFVVGSDVPGPMGPDLIPVTPARLDAFRRDHHARAVFAFDAVTGDVLRGL